MSKKWSQEQIDKLRAVYGPGATAEDINLAGLAQEFGRTLAAVGLKASRLGLGNYSRKKINNPKGPRKPMFSTPEELRAHQSKTMREWIAANGHPRGALGMKHTPETLAKVSAAGRRAWASPSCVNLQPEAVERRRQNMIKMRAAGRMFSGGFVAAAGGRRADLGDCYFRSSWEANYARYLNLLKARGEIADWKFESRRFVFQRVTRGTQSYTPDFEVIFPDGRTEWHEVKGWMNQKSRTRLDRMARYYPSEKIVLIQAAWFKQATRSGLSAVIPGWETKPKREIPISLPRTKP